MIWEELVKTALLGTDRHVLPSEVLNFLEENGFQTTAEEPELLAQAIALMVQYRKAGFLVEKFKGDHNPAIIQGISSSNYSQSVHWLLMDIFRSGFDESDPWHKEVLLSLKSHKKYLPEALLPIFFSSSDYQAFRQILDSIKDLLSPAAWWIIKMHPEWSKWTLSYSDEAWHKASQDDRIFLFRDLRYKDPIHAIRLLQESWQDFDFSTKVKWLEAYEIGLSLRDESFLESCLKDNSAKVRLAAQRLLCRLPQSDFSKSLFDEASKHLTLSNNRLLFKPSLKELKKPTQEALYNPEHLVLNPGQETLLWNWFSQIPPENWESLFHASPEQIIGIIENSDKRHLLFVAIAVSTVMYQSHRWAEALVASQLADNESVIWVVKDLAKTCRPDVLEDLCCVEFNRSAGAANPRTGLFKCLMEGFTSNWTDKLVQNAIRFYFAQLENLQDIPEAKNRISELARLIATRCNFDLLANLETEIGQHSKTTQDIGDLGGHIMYRKQALHLLSI